MSNLLESDSLGARKGLAAEGDEEDQPEEGEATQEGGPTMFNNFEVIEKDEDGLQMAEPTFLKANSAPNPSLSQKRKLSQLEKFN